VEGGSSPSQAIWSAIIDGVQADDGKAWTATGGSGGAAEADYFVEGEVCDAGVGGCSDLERSKGASQWGDDGGELEVDGDEIPLLMLPQCQTGIGNPRERSSSYLVAAKRGLLGEEDVVQH
ncbi:hypothetical protein Dimus_013027, partial [Dionaea muscipula]